MASSAEVLNDLEQVLMEVLGASLLASLLLGLGGGYWISSRYLARVDNIASTAQSIIGGDLRKRIAVQATDDELDRLAATLNAMLDRINELMESLRQVSNDIAHDLRTPLSRLRQRLESAQQLETSSAPVREKLDAAMSDTDGILETFSALLRIAQIEAGTRKSGFAVFDLSQTLANVCDAYAPALQDDQKVLTLEVESGIQLNGDRELLTQLIANLIENAARHTPVGSVVGISLNTEHCATLLRVSDNGPGVPVD
ncbi:MAG: HAMP domain-containing histidine kinase [Hyphomicrobiaceae bacterium]